MIAWGIINELGLKIEQLDDEVASDQHCIAELHQAMKLEEANHGSLLESVINEKTEQIKQLIQDNKLKNDMAKHDHKTEIEQT